VETDPGLQYKVIDGAEEKGKRGQNTQFSPPPPPKWCISEFHPWLNANVRNYCKLFQKSHTVLVQYFPDLTEMFNVKNFCEDPSGF